MRLRDIMELLVLVVVLQTIVGLAMYVLTGSKGEFVAYALLLVLSSSILGACVYIAIEKVATRFHAANEKEHLKILKKIREKKDTQARRLSKIAVGLAMEKFSEDERSVVSVMLERDGKIKQKELRKILGWSRGKTSNVVDEIVATGVVVKKPLLDTNLLILRPFEGLKEFAKKENK
jgi:uncharacterized membrane protein